MPKRIQRKRTRGYKLPPNTVCVSRPSKWGNPFRVGYKTATGTLIATTQMAVDLYMDHVLDPEAGFVFREMARMELAGKNLACWCKGAPCHADILLRIANS
jgi:hypothetical protein